MNINARAALGHGTYSKL